MLEAELVGASEYFGVERSLTSLDLPAIVLKLGFFWTRRRGFFETMGDE